MKNSLIVDMRFKNTNNWKDPIDEFNKFFRFDDGKGITNVGGFRPKSKSTIDSKNIIDSAFCLLITTFNDREWPDNLDLESGRFIYYGDNKSAGNLINETRIGGNKLLEKIFDDLHSNHREQIQPLLCFETYKDEGKAYMRFLGLAAPGGNGLSSDEDLVGVWKIKDGKRFQNYRAIFTIIDEAEIDKHWLQDLVDGISTIDSKYCPRRWKEWVQTGLYKALECKNEFSIRSIQDQIPKDKDEQRILDYLKNNLNDRQFEFASMEIIRLLNPNFRDLIVTPKVKDKGRDVVGKYYLGHIDHQVILDVSIEAKFFRDKSIGVREMMRLISRLKYSDIGIFVTTSSFHPQIQEELIEDNRPVLLVNGKDIAKILMKAGLSNKKNLEEWILSIKKKSD